MAKKRRVLAVTNMWPNEVDPSLGSFVRDQLESLRASSAPAQIGLVPRLPWALYTLLYAWLKQSLGRLLETLVVAGRT